MNLNKSTSSKCRKTRKIHIISILYLLFVLTHEKYTNQILSNTRRRRSIGYREPELDESGSPFFLKQYLMESSSYNYQLVYENKITKASSFQIVALNKSKQI